MPGRGNGGRGNGGRGNAGRGQAGQEHGRGREANTGDPRDERVDELGDSPGRSASSPGHRKKAAGAQSARDFAPGRRDLGQPMDQDEGETLA